MLTKSKNMKTKRFTLTFLTFLFAGLTVLSSCETSYCDCIKEAEKEKPDQSILDKCREGFSNMSMDEVDAAVKKCQE